MTHQPPRALLEFAGELSLRGKICQGGFQQRNSEWDLSTTQFLTHCPGSKQAGEQETMFNKAEVSQYISMVSGFNLISAAHTNIL